MLLFLAVAPATAAPEYVTDGDVLPGAIEPGSAFPARTFRTVAGRDRPVPAEDYVVVEVIRSADW